MRYKKVERGASFVLYQGTYTTKNKYGGDVLLNTGRTVISGGTFTTKNTSTIKKGISSVTGGLSVSSKAKLVNCFIDYYDTVY